MTAALSANQGRNPQGKRAPRRISEILRGLDAASGSHPIGVRQGPQQYTTHGGLVAIRQAWDVFGVDRLLEQVGIVKQDGVPASAVAFLQTTAPLFGRGTVRNATAQLREDPALPRICGALKPFAKQVVHRFLEDPDFDFEEFNRKRVERLQQIEETRFRHDGLFVVDGTLLRKTSTHFETIRHLYDHVTDSYVPAFDSVCVAYTRKNVEFPVSIRLRILNDEQRQYQDQLKAATESFNDLLECARKASPRGTVFIRGKDFSTANVKRADRAGISWIARVNQTLLVERAGELLPVKNLLRQSEQHGGYVDHPELGTGAACCQVKLPAYGRRIKLFALRSEKTESQQAFLTGCLELDELGFQELLHQLRGDFGEDKLDLALDEFRHLREMGTATHRVAFDDWFFCLRFCGGLSALHYHWYTQAGDRHHFQIRGETLGTQEVIARYRRRLKKVRGFPGIRARSIRARWPEYGTVELVVVEEQGRKPYLLVTDELGARVRHVVDTYKRRWRVEVLFRETKQNENLEGFRVRSVRAIKVHLALVLLTHTLVKLLGFIDDALAEKSIGEIKERIINVPAMVRRIGAVLTIIFSDQFELFYLMELLNLREERRRATKRVPP